MKKYALFIFMILTISGTLYSKQIKRIDNNEYNGVTDIVIFNLMEQKKFKIEQQSVYYDSNNILIKVENIYAKSFSKEKNVIKQIDYFDDKKIPIKFEIFFTESYTFQRNIDRIIEYVDQNDYVYKTEYYKGENMIYLETPELFKAYNDYQILSLNFCDDYLKKAYNQTKSMGGVTLFIDNWYLKGRTIVNFENDVKDLEELELYFINEVWNKSIPNLKYENCFKKILVSENDNKFWVVVNENDFNNNKFDGKALILFYYGGYNDNPIFMVTKIVK